MRMTIRMRDYHWNDDLGSVMEFLGKLCLQTKSIRNLIPSRIENRHYGPCGPEYKDEEDAFVKIWEEIDATKPPKIIAISVFSKSPDSYLSIHPNYKHHLREIMLEMEKHRATMPPHDDKGIRIAFWIEEDDHERISILEELGYEDLGAYEHNLRSRRDEADGKGQVQSAVSV